MPLWSAPHTALAASAVTPTGQTLVAGLAAIGILVLLSLGLLGWNAKMLVALVVGKDKRVSTSKVQATAWTYAICFALLTLLLGHLFYNGSGFDPGWKAFLASGLNSDYLWLLGIPATGLAGAKVITETKAAANPDAKPPKPEDAGTGLKQGLKELTGNDAADPEPALSDLQYVVFNLVALAYFLSAFLGHVGDGLPSLPDSLIALTGVSAASYLATKAAVRTAAPAIVPETVIVLGATAVTLTVSGTGFVPEGVTGEPAVMLGGVDLTVTDASATQLTATVPPKADAQARGLAADPALDLVVLSPGGTPSAGKPVNVSFAPD